MVDGTLPQDPVELEELARGKHRKLTLVDAYRILRDRWRHGDREREMCLHLLFLSWYGMIEPSFVFGDCNDGDELCKTFHDVLRYFEPVLPNDPELLYVIGLPLSMWPWMFGDEEFWETTAKRFRAQYRELTPNGLSPSVFADRGEFGNYYASQVSVEGGF